MFIRRYLLSSIFVTGLFAFSLQASEVLVSGTFAAGSKTNDSPLKKGSFELTVSVDNLPIAPGTSDLLYEWTLQFYDAGGNLLANLNASEPSTYGSLQVLSGATQGDRLIVGDSTSEDVLSLLFPAGFSGGGEITKSAAYSYGELNGSQKLDVKDGSAAPEPNYLGLLILMALFYGGARLKSSRGR